MTETNQVTRRILECVKDIREVLRDENAMGYLSITIQDEGTIHINECAEGYDKHPHDIDYWSGNDKDNPVPDWWVDPTGGDE